MATTHSLKSALIGLLLIGCAQTTTQPTPEARATTQPEARAALARTGKLRVGLVLGSPTQVIRDAGGQLKGVGFDLGKELAQRLGVPFEPVLYPAIGALLDSGKAGAWDVAFLSFTPARAREWDFAPVHLKVEFGYLVRSGSAISTMADLNRRGIRVAVEERSFPDIFLARTLGNALAVRATSNAGAAEMLKHGEANAIFGTKPTLFEMATHLPGSRVLDGRPGIDLHAMAMPKGRGIGVKYAHRFIEDAKSQGFVTAAIARTAVGGMVVAANDQSQSPYVAIVVRVLNTEADLNVGYGVGSINLSFYPLRLRAFASEFFKAEPQSIGLIAMQQVKENMTSCPISPENDHGAPCFARIIQREYENHGVRLETAGVFPYEYYNNNLPGIYNKSWEWKGPLGIVVECNHRAPRALFCTGAWRISSSAWWHIGTDSGGDSKRYLLETLLEYPEKGLRFRFYNTHLSHYSSNLGDQSAERYSQINEILSIMDSRVAAGELAPILAGDLNFLPDWQSDAATMSQLRYRFWWANESQFSKMHVWVGYAGRWSGTTGGFAFFGDPYFISLTQPYVIDGWSLTRLSDHDSPQVHLLCTRPDGQLC